MERIELERTSDRSEIWNPDEKNRIRSDLGFKESHLFRIRSYFWFLKLSKSDHIKFQIWIFLKNYGSDPISGMHFSFNSGSDWILHKYLVQNIWMRSDYRVFNFLNIIIGRGSVYTICTKNLTEIEFDIEHFDNTFWFD